MFLPAWPPNERKTMNELIDIKLTRQLRCLAVEVSLPPGDDQCLESVQVVLDGILINPERGQRHHRLRRYVRRFQEVTDWFPGVTHQLVVTARRQDGRETLASLDWTDL